MIEFIDHDLGHILHFPLHFATKTAWDGPEEPSDMVAKRWVVGLNML